MRALAFFLIVFVAGPALSADVYRSIDEKGIVKFSDRPDATDAERVVVVTAPPARPAVSSAAPARSAGDPAAGPIVVDGGETRREATPAERAEERARNCEIATERAERYRTSRRLYRELPNGEREYLDDAQIDAAKAQAEADVTRWCS
jgi:hypothetical protein